MSDKATSSSVHAYVDAVEEEVARILLKDKAGEWRGHNLPAAVLPAGAGEGSWLELSFKVIAPPEGEAAPKLRDKLGQGDRGGDIVL